MATQDYKVRIGDGTVITVAGVADVQRNGSGTTFYDADGSSVASFYAGEAKAHWPASATVEEPPGDAE